ncbi:MAG: DUF1848 family protein [Chitinivibrionales bacterium]|nr:DUF1848 family protein [Chitinivibrionales bacterium]
MNIPQPCYISASRRTDIPRFFADQFFAARKTGAIIYAGPYGGSYTVSLRAQDVLGYVFWSKDYGPFIAHPDFTGLIKNNNAVFHFTINDCPQLEPQVAALRDRIQTLERLCDLVGPQRVIWRYDPFCKFIGTDGQVLTNEDGFYRVAPQVAKVGVHRCVFSFMSLYNKTRRRQVEFAAFTEEEQRRICKSISAAAQDFKIDLFNCCNPEVLGFGLGIKQAHCVDEELLAATDRFGVHPKSKLKLTPTRAGCGCYQSRDIGAYNPACKHGCLYCYAHPEIK